MKRLFIIWLFMMGAFAAKAQTLQVFGPDSICLSSYATFDALYTGNNLISYKWTFSQTPSAVTGNSDTSRNLTVTFADTGTVTATCTVTYGNSKPYSVVSATKQMKILLCRSSTCLGTSSPTPFFTENFGSQQGTNNYWYLGQNGSSGTTTYAQGQPGNVQDGSYIVTVNPQIAKSNWANISDHTGNTNGGMMVINADLAPGIFYTRTVTGLCQGAQYTFNAWLLTVNLQNSLESGDAGGSYKWVNVTFLVYNALNNQLIDSVNTADVPMNLGNPNSWKQYGFTFKSPPNVDSVKVVMRNNGLGGSGNDLAIDDIQFTYCGPQLITTLKDSTATGDTVCAGNPLTLQATINPQNYFNNVQYQWQVSKDGTTWDSIPNSNNALLNINTLPTDTTHAIYYRFIAADVGNIGVSTCISPSNTFSLLVLKSPNISPKDTTICLGGAATLSAQVGYTNYKWSTGDTTSSISVKPTATTSYKVSATLVTPKLGSCTDTATATVTVFNSLLLNLGNDTSICQGGSLVLNAAIPGATQYLWSTGATTPTITVSTSGKYWVKASYSSYCFASDTINVTVKPLPIVTASAPANVCAGSGIQLTTNNAATKFSWTGPNGFGSLLQNPLIANPTTSAGGVYTVTGTDINGCSNNASAMVNVNPLPVVLDTVTNVSCYGSSDGAVSIGVSGGSTPYIFKWNTNAPTKNISGLVAGNYSDTITDAKGCKTTIAAIVTQPAKLSVTATVDSVSCFGAKNGKVALNVTGGTGPYTYLWSNDSTSSTISHADTGHYSVIVTDAHGCTAFDTVVVFQPAKLSVLATVDSVSCFGAKNGKVALNVTGGTLSYSYLWSNSFKTPAISSLDTGHYSVIVTDANGCTAFDTAVVSQPVKLSVTATVDSVSCFGAKDGKVALNVTGGTGPYTFLWSNDSTSSTISHADTGHYSVIVKDAHGCTAFDTVVVFQPAKLSVTATVDSVSCFGAKNGKVTLNVTGGTLSYSYLWSNSLKTPAISSLDTGHYSVIVTDAHGCTAFDTVTVFQPVKLSVTAIVDSVSCFGAKNGKVALNMTGGTGTYTYLWNYGATTSTISSLDTGRYSVIVTDANGCTAFDTVTVFQPAKLSVTATVDSVSCFGAKNGKVTVNVTGGTGTYTFLWNNNLTSSSISPLDTGHYSVIVTDANGCTAFDTVTVSQPAKLSVTATVDSVSCFGAKNGKVTLNVTGGTLSYSYLWSNGPNLSTISSLDTGHYSVIVTDGHDCTAFDTIVVFQPAKLSVTATVDSVTCFGAKNGKVTLNVTGGTLSYSYLWSNGSTLSTISSLDTGHYSVIVTDAHGCTAFDTVIVSQPAKLSVTTTVDSVSCFGAKNGKVALNVTGGTLSYSYLWSNSLKTPTTSSLDTGHYSVIVTDAHGCTAFDTVIVSQPAKLSVTATVDGVSCFGTKNGKVALNVTGGTLSYSYLWNNSLTTSSISSLDTGRYSVIVTDANGCTAFDTVVVFQPAKLSVTATVDSVSCFGAKDGKVALNVTGGTLSYSYLWNNSLTTSSISPLDTGHYSVIVTDAHGCTAFDTVTVSQVAKLSVTATVDSVSCFGAKDGKVALNVIGGTGPYTFLWSNDSTSSTISHADTGHYSVIVKDAHGCIAFDTVVVFQPALLTLTAISTPVKCYGQSNGSITVTASGGTSPYQYSLNGVTFQGSNVFSNLAAKPYTITVKDANGCTTSVPDTVTQPSVLAATALSMPVTCNGQSNGSITVTASGGTTAYQYSIDGGAFQGSNIFSNLAAKPYIITVKDANGCTTSVPDTVTQPLILAATAVSIPVKCYGQPSGSITVTVSGGTSPYQYSLNGVAFQSSNIFMGLVANPYTVTVKDANGCTTSVPDTVTQPSVLTATAVSIPVTCYGQPNGSIAVTASGGTTSYQYSIDGGAFQSSNIFNTLIAKPYIITVKDANGCTTSVPDTVTQPLILAATAASIPVKCYGQPNGSITVTASGGTTPYQYSIGGGAFQGSNVFSNLAAKPYIITVKDANSCTTSVPDTVSQPPLLTATAVSIPVTCYGQSNGTITVTASGGTTAYLYSLNGAAFQSSNVFTGLVAKSYTITVKDANGCTISIPDTVAQPPLLAATAVSTPVKCYGQSNGSITVTASGGTIAYQYSIDGGAFQGSNIFNNLIAKPYTITVKDANGCTISVPDTVTQPSVLAATAVSMPVTCYGQSNGSITVTASGGTIAYQYSIDGGAFQGSNIFTGLVAKPYIITVKDANGCTTSVPDTVAQPSKLTVTGIVSNVSCNGGNNGAINLTIGGGTGSYTYTWSNGSASQNLSNLVAGTYSVIVKDANGCTAYDTATVTQPARLTISHAIANVTCFGSNNGAITLNVTGGTGAYIFIWNNKASSQDISGLSAGKYSVISTDANGCTATDSAVIAQPALLTAAVSAKAVTCYGLGNGSIRITASGGTAPYQYSLDGTNFQGSNTFNGLAPGSYIAIVRDGNSCTTTTPVAITQPDSLAVSDVVTNVSCYGDNNGAVNLKVTGGTAPYSFNWNNAATTQNITGLTAGSYIAGITDANGCNARDTAIVSQPLILAFSTDLIPVKCKGGNDGAIIISPSGGTAPYQYSLDGRNFQNNNRFNNLTANTYTVTVRDANACSISAVEHLTTLAPPSIPSVTAGAICGGGNITLKAAGAQANEDYRWYGDSGTATLLQTNGNIYTTAPVNQTATFYTAIYNTVTGCESSRIPVVAAVHPLPLITATGGTACEGGTVLLRSSGGSSYRWTGPGFSSDEQNPAISQIAPAAAGIYTVIATDANGCSNTATAPVAVDLPPVVQLGNDTLLAKATPYVLDAANPGATYQWSTGAATRQITADTAGTYRVNVSKGACTVSDSIRIRYFIPPVVNLVHDTTLCTGESLTLKATNPGATYKWNDGTTSDTLVVTRPGKYWVEAKKFTATASDTIRVDYLSPAAINLGRDTVLCQGAPLTLDAGVPGLSYFWNTHERTQKIQVDAPGVYWVIASNGACLARDSIRVSYDPLPAVNLTPDTTICRGESLTLNAYNPGAAYLWSTGDTTASVTVNTQNTFGVTVTRGACTVRDSLRLFLNPPPNISLRKDTILCDGQSLLLDAGSSISTSYRWNDGSSDPVKIINAPGQYWVLAAYGICLARDTITVSLRKPPAVQLGSNLSICAGQKVILRPNLKKALFTWNDNSSGDSLTVTQPGKYWLTAMDLQCGTLSSDTVNVMVKGPPAVSLGNDTAICKGEYITLIPKAADIIHYRWQDGSSGSSFRTNQEGIYTVTVANECGNNTANIRVRTTDCSVTGDLYMPNAFTPNHDGHNDFFRPKYFVTITYFEMFVYNRWGQLVCRTQNIDKGWDGTFNGQPCDLGTYVWYIRYKKQNNPKEYFKKGDVILVR